MFSYLMPTDIRFGKSCLKALKGIVSDRKIKRPLIFTGRAGAEKSGALKEVIKRLSNTSPIIFNKINPNPTIESLKEGLRISRKNNADMIVAIGGGSVIDYAKAVSVLSKQKQGLNDFFYKNRRLNKEKVFFVAISTTFGTSSEITPYAVMTDKLGGGKTTLADESMFPDIAFTDPGFTLTMPKPIVAVSCADLLTHSIEAYWSINSNILTDYFAEQAISLFLRYYKKTYQNPMNLKIRQQLSLASLFAGLAFSNTRTTACHSISYPMTAIFNIPHGIACALTLGEMLGFNYTNNHQKILALCRIMNCNNIKKAKQKISTILSDLNVHRDLRSYGISRKDLHLIVEKGFTPSRMKANPRRVRKKDLYNILVKIY